MRKRSGLFSFFEINYKKNELYVFNLIENMYFCTPKNIKKEKNK